MSFDVLNFKLFGENYFVGTNTSDWYPNGFQTNVDYSKIDEIFIPSHFNNKTIIAIGQYAFYKCSNLKRVHIQANLLEIHFFAFFGCYKLEYINIPASCHSIYKSALDCRYDNPSGNDIFNKGTFTIVFDPGSNISYFGPTAIENAAYFLIYVYDKVFPKVQTKILGSEKPTKTKVLSPYLYKFCGIQTTLFQQITMNTPIFFSRFRVYLCLSIIESC